MSSPWPGEVVVLMTLRSLENVCRGRDDVWIRPWEKWRRAGDVINGVVGCMCGSKGGSKESQLRLG